MRFLLLSLSSRDEVISAVEELASRGYDLIAFVRGGGSGLEVFNSLEIAKKVLSLNRPVVSAIGHAADRSLLDSVVDLSFITPTAFGHFLREVAEEAIRRSRLVELEKELSRTKERVENLSRENFRLKVIIAIAILAVIFMLFLRQ